MGKKLPRPDLHTQAEFVLFAAVHGDEAAVTRFHLSARSLQRYREIARDPKSELSQTVAAYATALNPTARASSFVATLDKETTDLVRIFREKAAGVNAANPEGLRAIGEMVGRFLDHKLGLEYVDRLFGGPETGAEDAGPTGEER